MVNEDSEMAARFLANGERLICLPAMAAQYVPRDTLTGLWRQYLRYGEFRALTARRHPASMRPSQLLPPAVVIMGITAIVAPGRLRRLARVGAAAYGATLLRAAAGARGAADPRSDVVLVPVVLPIMHAAHGTGQIIGWCRYGPPLRAIAACAGLGRLAASPPVNAALVYAPSLQGDGE